MIKILHDTSRQGDEEKSRASEAWSKECLEEERRLNVMKLRASTFAKTAALILKLSKSSQEAVEDVASRLVVAQLLSPPGLPEQRQ